MTTRRTFLKAIAGASAVSALGLPSTVETARSKAAAWQRFGPGQVEFHAFTGPGERDALPIFHCGAAGWTTAGLLPADRSIRDIITLERNLEAPFADGPVDETDPFDAPLYTLAPHTLSDRVAASNVVDRLMARIDSTSPVVVAVCVAASLSDLRIAEILTGLFASSDRRVLSVLGHVSDFEVNVISDARARMAAIAERSAAMVPINATLVRETSGPPLPGESPWLPKAETIAAHAHEWMDLAEQFSAPVTPSNIGTNLPSLRARHAV